MGSMQIEDEILEDDDYDDGSGGTRTTFKEQKWQIPPDIPSSAVTNINMENNTTPMDFFYLLFPDELINIVVQETNKRVQQKDTALRKMSKN
ncbi:hypothetical protein JTB14_023529 [Gonioctena quinquepunctata]|nr:hypothetical protein JTB14_023529 [Gonioctena quinquepunctata]